MLKRSLLLLTITCLGCGGQNTAIEGKVVITSTKGFEKMKASKSPPPQVPKQ
jgi:hypothetical protein